MKLNYVYEGEETPEERLRNKLQPFYFLIDKLTKDGHCNDFPEVLKACQDNLESINNHLADIRPFYLGNADIIFTKKE